MKGGWCTGRAFKCFPPWAFLYIVVSFKGGYSPTKILLLFSWLNFGSKFLHATFFSMFCGGLALSGAVINVMTGVLSFSLPSITTTHAANLSDGWQTLTSNLTENLFLRYSVLSQMLHFFSHFVMAQMFRSVSICRLVKPARRQEHKPTASASLLSLSCTRNWNSPQDADKPR